MARKLKVFQTSLGFFDLAIAAPSMKAALEAWGADSNLFHQGAAKESKDPDVVAATMAKPGVVLKRPVGSNGSFKEHADLPTHLGDDGSRSRPTKSTVKPKKSGARATDPEGDRKAVLAFEKEEARREKQRRKEEAAREKERDRRQRVVEKAQEALDQAKRAHEERAAAIEAEREALDERSRAEEARWEREKERLENAVRRARDD
jgi:hypothetical protein